MSRTPTDFDFAGQDKEFQAQKKAQDDAKEAYAAIDFSSTSPSSLVATAQTQIAAVASEVEAGNICDIKFSPNLLSAVGLFMDAITNPIGAVLDSLQSLMNNIGFMPPGLGLPRINLGLGLDFDFKLNLGGGFDIGSMLSSIGSLLQFPSIKGCDALLPDIGPGAALIAGALPAGIKQGESGGMANPLAALGCKQIKLGFDPRGNPIQEVVTEGCPATIPRVDIRYQANPSPKAVWDYPANPGHHHANDDTVPPAFRTIVADLGLGDVFNQVGEGSFKDLVELAQAQEKKEEETPQVRGGKLFGQVQGGTGKESTLTTGKIGGADRRSQEEAKHTGTDIYYA